MLDNKQYTNANQQQEFPLFNTHTGSFGAMNDEIHVLYNSANTFDTDKIEDDYIKRQIEIMAANGFLIDFDTDELNWIKCIERLSRYDNSTLSLTIAPTLDCNMDCPYCFEQKNGHVMSDEVQNAIIEYVRKMASTISLLGITWYGGEPLLEIEIIRRLSKEFINICQESNIRYMANIITNGYYLTQETAKMLHEECKIGNAQVTIDGYGETHDQRRCLKNGESSFEVIVNNVETASKYFHVSIRSNIDKNNSKDAKRLMDFFFLERKWNSNSNLHVYFSPVQDSNDPDGNGCAYSLTDFTNIHNELMEYLYEIKAYESIIFTIPKPVSRACGAITSNSIVIDPDGDIYKCYEIIGNKKYVIGNVFSDIKLNKNLLEWLLLDILPECEKCKLLPICHSACPLKRINQVNRKCSNKMASYMLPLEIAYMVHVKNLK